MIEPKLLDARRIKGNNLVVPDVVPDVVPVGVQLLGAFKYCIDPAGHVTDVNVVRSTRDPDYDLKIAGRIRGWEFQPVVVDGAAIAVCGAVTFIYQQR